MNQQQQSFQWLRGRWARFPGASGCRGSASTKDTQCCLQPSVASIGSWRRTEWQNLKGKAREWSLRNFLRDLQSLDSGTSPDTKSWTLLRDARNTLRLGGWSQTNVRTHRWRLNCLSCWGSLETQIWESTERCVGCSLWVQHGDQRLCSCRDLWFRTATKVYAERLPGWGSVSNQFARNIPNPCSAARLHKSPEIVFLPCATACECNQPKFQFHITFFIQNLLGCWLILQFQMLPC